MAAEFFGSSPEIDVRRRYALSLLKNGTDASPAQGPLVAIARALQGGMGGYLANRADVEDKAAGSAMFDNLPGLGGAAPAQPSAPTAPTAPTAAAPNYGNAISSIESGGKYDALGPVTKTGDRAYGKYQVMGANVGPWSREVLGQELTPQAFVASPQAQDTIFNAKFGQYAQKYGPEGAAKAWFAGERGMNDPNRKDQLGTTVAQYGQKFTTALGPQEQPYQVAGPATAAPQATPASPQGVPAAPGRTQMQIPPEAAATIRRLGSDPRTRAQAWQLYLQYAKPTEQYVQGVDEGGIPFQKNTTTGKIEADPRRDTAINEVEYAKRNWQKLGFPDPNAKTPDTQKFWQDFNAKRLGGPSTNVTVDQRGENEFSKEAGKLTAKRYAEIVDEVPQAKQMLSDVQTLTTLGKQIGTGKEAQVKAALGPYAQALGIDVEKLPEIQAFEAIVNRVGPSLRVKGSGAQSDYELKNFLKSLPTLGNTPEGNDLAARVMQGLYENKLKAGEIASSVLNGDITRKEADRQIRELPDPMKEYRDYVKKNPGASVRPNDEGGWTVIDGVQIKPKAQ
ncbi:MAG: hypothetical protein WC213_00275 [Arenimonas sp.]|jgi:hypothetical protein